MTDECLIEWLVGVVSAMLWCVTGESDAKKSKSRRSCAASSNQPSIADMFAKRYTVGCSAHSF